MDFPIRTSELRDGSAFRKYSEKIKKETLEKEIHTTVNDIAGRIMNQPTMYHARNSYTLQWMIPKSLHKQSMQSMRADPYNLGILTISEFLPPLLTKLQEVFPDMSIQVDPLKTYILFDWSH